MGTGAQVRRPERHPVPGEAQLVAVGPDGDTVHRDARAAAERAADPHRVAAGGGQCDGRPAGPGAVAVGVEHAVRRRPARGRRVRVEPSNWPGRAPRRRGPRRPGLRPARAAARPRTTGLPSGRPACRAPGAGRPSAPARRCQTSYQRPRQARRNDDGGRLAAGERRTTRSRYGSSEARANRSMSGDVPFSGSDPSASVAGRRRSSAATSASVRRRNQRPAYGSNSVASVGPSSAKRSPIRASSSCRSYGVSVVPWTASAYDQPTPMTSSAARSAACDARGPRRARARAAARRPRPRARAAPARRSPAPCPRPRPTES